MSLLGVHLTLLAGPHVPTPVPPPLVEALTNVEVTHSDEGRSGFQLSFHAGRSGPTALVDPPPLLGPWLQPFSRVVVLVSFGPRSRVLMDGVITDRQFSAGGAPRSATVTVTGEDLSVLMDLDERSVEHPAQHDGLIALKLIGAYAAHGIAPLVVPPPTLDVPLPMERVPVQQGTDLAHLKLLAQRNGYVFHVTPGPAPLTSVAYWGPPKRTELPQPALSVDLGAETNVESISFRHDALRPTRVSGNVQDRSSGSSLPVAAFTALRPPLAAMPALLTQPFARTQELRDSGVTVTEALGRAQAITDASSDAVTADGELDGLRYGDALRARGIVGVRGAGWTHDGLWYVKRVTHVLASGSYRQRFQLARDGAGATVPAVPV